jgi:short-subunit dehydrogenase
MNAVAMNETDDIVEMDSLKLDLPQNNLYFQTLAPYPVQTAIWGIDAAQ